MITKLGLIGYPLGHSFSAGYFKNKFETEKIEGYSYQNFEISTIDLFPKIISDNPELLGLNVTIPYKEAVIPFLDELSPEAAAIGAVNTIKIIRKNGTIKLKGFNTDCHGFKESLKPFLASNHYNALILGTGGAAKAVEYILKEIGIEVMYVSRNASKKNEISYEVLNEIAMKRFPLIINSTPLGMFPKTEVCPDIPYEYLDKNNLLFDLIYNPEETLFLKKGREKGAITLNGLQMLKLQAEKAWEIWTE